MKYRAVGNSGLNVSVLAYGNWLTHGSQIAIEVALSCVHAALDVGITTFDTADAYAGGRAEIVLGQALSSERRESLEVLTKVYFPTGPAANNRGLSRKHISTSIDRSLRRLRMDYVDIYQAHRFDENTPLEETMAEFARVVRAGKALYIGVSEWNADQIRAAHSMAKDLHIPLISNQPEYSALWRTIEPDIAPICRELGIGQIVWSPLAQGVLTGKYSTHNISPLGTRAGDAAGGSQNIRGYLQPKILEAVRGLEPLASARGLSVAQLCLAWVIRNADVSSAIIGASRPSQIRDNAGAVDINLSGELVEQVDNVLSEVAVLSAPLR